MSIKNYSQLILLSGVLLLVAAVPPAHAHEQRPMLKKDTEQIVAALKKQAHQKMLAGDWAAAVALLQKAVALQPADETLRKALLQAQRQQHGEGDLKPEAAPDEVPINEKDAGGDAKTRRAKRKQALADLAIRDGDYILAERFFEQARELAPQHMGLRHAYAQFLADQGRGRDALKVLDSIPREALSAEAEYLKIKLRGGRMLDGLFREYEKTLTKHDGTVVHMPADKNGSLHIDAGEVTWIQKIRGELVTQRFTFAPHKLKTGQDHYEIELTWRKLDTNLENYVPDRLHPMVIARKFPQGWTMVLQADDDFGGRGVTRFKADVPNKME